MKTYTIPLTELAACQADEAINYGGNWHRKLNKQVIYVTYIVCYVILSAAKRPTFTW